MSGGNQRINQAIETSPRACRNFTSAWLEGALDDLVSRGLMLKDGKSYLSLAILALPNIPSTSFERPVSDIAGQAEGRAGGLVQLSPSPQPPIASSDQLINSGPNPNSEEQLS